MHVQDKSEYNGLQIIENLPNSSFQIPIKKLFLRTQIFKEYGNI